MVVEYTQNGQRWLRGRIVKFGHGKHYKEESFAVYRGHNAKQQNTKKLTTTGRYTRKQRENTILKKLRRLKSLRKDKGNPGKRKREKIKERK